MVAIAITDDGVEVDPLADIEVHPAAELFPLMHGVEFDELVADIAAHGQRDAIVLTPDGQLLDGRNRWRACAKAGVDPATRTEAAEPWAYVISTNVHRRHLNESQRAMLATRIAQRANGERRRPASSIGEADPRPLPPTRVEAAHLLSVGATSIDRAAVVRKLGTDNLQHAVERGDVPVYTAARVARSLSAEGQDEFAHRVVNGALPPDLLRLLRRRSRCRGLGHRRGRRTYPAIGSRTSVSSLSPATCRALTS